MVTVLWSLLALSSVVGCAVGLLVELPLLVVPVVVAPGSGLVARGSQAVAWSCWLIAAWIHFSCPSWRTMTLPGALARPQPVYNETASPR